VASVSPGAEGSGRMKRDLIWGWVFVALAILMVFCVFVNINNDNWEAMPICVFALILDTINAINRFVSYRRFKDYHKSFNNMNRYIIQELWPDEEDYRQS